MSKKDHITQLLAKIQPAISAETQTKMDRSSKNSDFVNKVTELNIANTLQQIYRDSEILRLMIEQENIGLVGAIYDVNTGKVAFKDYSTLVKQIDSAKVENQLAEKVQKVWNSAEMTASVE